MLSRLLRLIVGIIAIATIIPGFILYFLIWVITGRMIFIGIMNYVLEGEYDDEF
jgi:hypothetical protein